MWMLHASRSIEDKDPTGQKFYCDKIVYSDLQHAPLGQLYNKLFFFFFIAKNSKRLFKEQVK